MSWPLYGWVTASGINNWALLNFEGHVKMKSVLAIKFVVMVETFGSPKSSVTEETQ